jgi:hypothetical protein
VRAQAPDGDLVLGVVDELRAHRLPAAQRPAQGADGGPGGEDVHPLADQRRAAALGAVVASGGQDVHALAQEGELEVGLGERRLEAGHGPGFDAGDVGTSRERMDLVWDDGSGQEQRVCVDRGWTRIGRSLIADVRLDGPDVARRHALLVARADGVHLMSDGVADAVRVNGRPGDGRLLADGDRIEVGGHVLRVEDRVRQPAG